ncbi:unnamed protein product [marine sediment metagenome]|uniref:Uncharacterized protein n=1 Tax=marine sediment metagenome TaxID=412755 RepID=X1I5N4_9ZZZZ
MQEGVPKFRSKTTIVDPKELARIFDIVARHDYRLGAQMA